MQRTHKRSEAQSKGQLATTSKGKDGAEKPQMPFLLSVHAQV